MLGIICPSPVEIGLTKLPEYGGGWGDNCPPDPTVTTAL